MRRILALLVLLSPGVFCADVKLRIDCREQKCEAWPAALELRNGDRIAVTSAKKWTCAVAPAEEPAKSPPEEPPPEEPDKPPATPAANCAWKQKSGGAPTDLIFKSEGLDPVKVPFVMVADSETGGGRLTILALCAFLAGLLSLTLGAIVFLASGEPGKVLANWQSGTEEAASRLKPLIGQTLATLKFDPIRRPPPQPLKSVATPPPYAGFLTALDSWCGVAGRIPAEIPAVRQVIENTAGKITTDHLLALEQDIVELAIHATDGDADPQHREPSLQSALIGLIEAAGLQAIFPKPGEYFNDAMHEASGEKLPAPAKQYRGRIGFVVIRGLARDGYTLKKAEVKLFD